MVGKDHGLADGGLSVLGSSPRFAARRWLAVGVAAVVLLGAGFAAGKLTLTPPASVPAVTDDQVLVEVVERTIGQTLDYGARTSREVQPIATNALAGVVTAVTQDPVAERKVGDVLLEVGGVPVRVVQGTVPFHRALTEGAAGVDVSQLEGALVGLGYLKAADTTFDAATTQAVNAWQRALGMPVTGSVGLGELVAAPTLPASIIVDTKVVWRGAVLAGGEVVVSMGTGDPRFILPLSPGQLNLVPADAPMTVEGFGKSWPAHWDSSAQDADLGVGELITLASPDGGPVCADECDVVPAEQSWVTVHIEVVPRTTGPTVPISAVTTDASGQAWVMVVEGQTRHKRNVTVQRAHAGLAVVEGVNVGERVQALGTQSETAESGGSQAPTAPETSASPQSPETTENP